MRPADRDAEIVAVDLGRCQRTVDPFVLWRRRRARCRTGSCRARSWRWYTIERCACENGTSSLSDSTTYCLSIGRKYSKNVRMCALTGKLRRSVLRRCAMSTMPTKLSAPLNAATQRHASPSHSIVSDSAQTPRHSANGTKRDGSSLSMGVARVIAGTRA